MSHIKTNKIAWIVAVAICTPFVWLGIQNLVGQDLDPFGENSGTSTQTETVEDPFGESQPAAADPTPVQVPDNEDPFGEGTGSNPVDEPSEMQNDDLPASSTPFGSNDTEQATPFGSTPDPADEDPFGESNLTDSTDNSKTSDAAANQNQKTFAAGEFEKAFWGYLSANNYKNWAPAPQQDGDFYTGKSPHGMYLKMYMNRTAIANTTELPNGSVIVKENYGPDRSLKAITVMYRSTGYNPKGKDWYWVKYNPDGTVARTGIDEGSMKIAGASKSCIECHESADGDDFVFFND